MQIQYIYDKIKMRVRKIRDSEKLNNIESYMNISEELYNTCVTYHKQGYDVLINDDLTIQPIFNEDKFNLINTMNLSNLRLLRAPILAAFDLYKSNVNYGITTEDAETKEKITFWYHQLLDLNEEAFKEENIPSQIKYYL